MGEFTVSAILRALRAKTGETQEQVSEACGISKVALARYETGNRKPRLEKASLLADHYGVSVDFILGREDSKPSAPERAEVQANNNKKRGDIDADDLEGEIAHIAPSAIDVLSQFLRLMNSLPEDKQAQVAEYALMCAKIHEMEAEKTGGDKE